MRRTGDGDGIVRLDVTGEGQYVKIEKTIQGLLRELNPQVQLPAMMPPAHDFDQTNAVCYVVTPELYLGRARNDFGNPEAASTNTIITFHLPAERYIGVVYARGDWSIHDDYMRHAVDKDDLTDCLMLKYQAVECNVVMKPESVYWMQVFVEIDGAPVPKDYAGKDIRYDDDGRSFVKMNMARLYNLTRRQPYRSYEVRLSARGQGLSVYGFSFGTSIIPKDDLQLRSAKD